MPITTISDFLRRRASAQKAYDTLGDLVRVTTNQPKLTGELAKAAKYDKSINTGLLEARVELESYLQLLDGIAKTTAIAWPPDATSHKP